MSLHYFEQSFRSNTSVEIVAHIWRHIVVINFVRNKFIGDDTKAAARQSPNCIKKNKIWWKTIFNMADGILTPCNVARSWHWCHQVTAPFNLLCGSGIMTVNSPSGSTLQCDTWLWDDMALNLPVAAPCNVTRSYGIATLNSPGDSTLQYGRWLWDDMKWNSLKRPPYWNSTSDFEFDHTTTVDMSFCTSLQNFIQIGPPSGEKN